MICKSPFCLPWPSDGRVCLRVRQLDSGGGRSAYPHLPIRLVQGLPKNRPLLNRPGQWAPIAGVRCKLAMPMTLGSCRLLELDGYAEIATAVTETYLHGLRRHPNTRTGQRENGQDSIIQIMRTQ